MYAPGPAYGYGPGPDNSTQFNNPNGMPSQQQQAHNLHPHHKQQPQSQPQQLGQQPQHMMYNPLQYAGAVPPHQSPYGAQAGGGGPAVGGIAGGMGMMQNNGMAHMPTGPHVSAYQTPYSSSPYVGNMPTSTAPGLPPNFMPTTAGASSFPMNAASMNPQLQAQRMQPPSSTTPTQAGPRASPFPGAPQHTPPHAVPNQQVSTPQVQNQTQSQTTTNTQQAQAGTILTPQTPNFPPGAQGPNAGPIATPLSPGSETRERDRVTVLLEINKFLLMEVMRLQAAQAESKKEESAAGNSPDATEKEKADKEKEKAEKAKPASRDYFECMRRLQSNLAYLAAIADRSHKPSSQIPPHPAIMSAPTLSPRPTQTNSTTSASPKVDGPKKEEPEEYKPEGLDDDHGESLREQYKKLQALFPGVDPKKEPPVQPAAVAAARQQAQQMMAAKQGAQGQGQPTGQATDPNAQQKLQNDLLRQKMMQAQQAQQAAQQQMQAGGMQGMNPQQQQGGPVQNR